jgi:hypothetical protein
MIIDVPSREEALHWAAKIAAALPLRPGDPRVRARPGRGQLIGRVSLVVYPTLTASHGRLGHGRWR